MPTLGIDQVDRVLATGASCRIDAPVAPRFRAGDRIIVRNLNPVGHTRLPRYVRGKHGRVESDRGIFAFPDSNAHGKGHKPQHVYSVRFTARELWGDQASDRDTLYLDLWDDYMDHYPG